MAKTQKNFKFYGKLRVNSPVFLPKDRIRKKNPPGLPVKTSLEHTSLIKSFPETITTFVSPSRNPKIFPYMEDQYRHTSW